MSEIHLLACQISLRCISHCIKTKSRSKLQVVVQAFKIFSILSHKVFLIFHFWYCRIKVDILCPFCVWCMPHHLPPHDLLFHHYYSSSSSSSLVLTTSQEEEKNGWIKSRQLTFKPFFDCYANVVESNWGCNNDSIAKNKCQQFAQLSTTCSSI